MAKCLAARLTAQEDQIRLLSGEICTLSDSLSRGVEAVVGVAAGVSPVLESLRTENEKLKYRLLHLRRGLQAELKEEAARGEKGPVKCGKAPQKINNNTGGEQRTGSRANEKVTRTATARCPR